MSEAEIRSKGELPVMWSIIVNQTKGPSGALWPIGEIRGHSDGHLSFRGDAVMCTQMFSPLMAATSHVTKMLLLHDISAAVIQAQAAETLMGGHAD